MITKQDITKLEKVFVTRWEFNARFDQMEEKFEAFRTEIKDLVLTAFSNIKKELKVMRKEHAALLS